MQARSSLPLTHPLLATLDIGSAMPTTSQGAEARAPQPEGVSGLKHACEQQPHANNLYAPSGRGRPLGSELTPRL